MLLALLLLQSLPASQPTLPLDPALDFELFARLVLDAVQAGNAALLVALALVGLVALTRYVFADELPFLKTDLGAALYTFLLGFFGAAATALAGGASLSGALLLAALKVALTAMGGYSALKKLALPLLRKLLALFGVKLSDEQKALDAAKKAGNAAVAAKPAGGVDAVVGKPLELP